MAAHFVFAAGLDQNSVTGAPPNMHLAEGNSSPARLQHRHGPALASGQLKALCTANGCRLARGDRAAEDDSIPPVGEPLGGRLQFLLVAGEPACKEMLDL